MQRLASLFNETSSYQAEFDTFKVNFDTILPLTLQTGALNDAVATDLTTFKARGGKMIIFEGVSDPVFSANDLRDWYRQLQHDTPGTQDFARLFMVPGMTQPWVAKAAGAASRAIRVSPAQARAKRRIRYIRGFCLTRTHRSFHS